jgi:hypothetical protein
MKVERNCRDGKKNHKKKQKEDEQNRKQRTDMRFPEIKWCPVVQRQDREPQTDDRTQNVHRRVVRVAWKTDR